MGGEPQLAASVCIVHHVSHCPPFLIFILFFAVAPPVAVYVTGYMSEFVLPLREGLAHQYI